MIAPEVFAAGSWFYSPWMLALVGLCIGSFLNVVIHRLPQMLEHQWRRDSAEMLGLDAARGGCAADPVEAGVALPRMPPSDRLEARTFRC